jgi:hypothetical protein
MNQSPYQTRCGQQPHNRLTPRSNENGSTVQAGVQPAESYNGHMTRYSNEETQVLLIDRAAAAELASADAIREWAGEKRAFISSVMTELRAERQAVSAGIRAVGLRPVMFEEFGGRDAGPEEAYLAEVEGSDIYIGILGKRYGKPLKTRYSPTHAEYRHAEQHALRIAVWTLDTDEREGPEQSFLDEVRTFHVAPGFSSVDDLRRQIEERMRVIAAEDLAPWCKLGNVVFRAMEIEDRGGVVQVKARVRGDLIARALEDMRGDRFNRGSEARFTWSGRSKYIKVKGFMSQQLRASRKCFVWSSKSRKLRTITSGKLVSGGGLPPI